MFCSFWLRSMCDLSSLNRYQTSTPCIGKRSLKNQTAREVPKKLWSILFLTPYTLKPMAFWLKSLSLKSLSLWSPLNKCIVTAATKRQLLCLGLEHHLVLVENKSLWSRAGRSAGWGSDLVRGVLASRNSKCYACHVGSTRDLGLATAFPLSPRYE